MAAKCAREECGKTVYPLEELKCLDKVWHKQCFKCSVCGMTLSMKNYKGYEKKPYCEPHYPKTVASVVVDTPEMLRLAKNTNYQSQVKYHADYEKMKGTKIEVANDPELMRHLTNSKIQSQAQYHGELEKKKTQDTNRPKEELANSATSSTIFGLPVQNLSINGNGVLNNGNETQRQNSYGSQATIKSSVSFNSAVSNVATCGSSAHGSMSPSSGFLSNIGITDQISQQQSSFSDLDEMQHQSQQHHENWNGNKGDSPYTQRLNSQAGTIVYSSEMGGRIPAQERQVGSIADYDPLNGNWGTSGKSAEKHEEPESVQKTLPTPTTSASVAATNKGTSKAVSTTTASSPAQQKSTAASANKGFTVKALYDYTAADTDEVSFEENDIIVNCQNVDEGWLTGTVQRTLQFGMLPANYVERINQPTGLFKLH